MKKFILLLLAIFIAISCTKEEENIFREGTGNWRLESVTKPITQETVQYEHVNIVFSFDQKTVTISGNDGSFSIENGIYPYSFAKNNEIPTYTIKIDKWEYSCYFEENKMIFSRAHVDGEVFIFHKLYFL